MLTKEAIFRQIDADQVEPIQQLVTVDYDNAIQMPVSFRYRDHHYEVTELIGSFRESPYDPSVLYLVRARQGVYALYRDLTKPGSQFLWHGQWVLHFKVEEEKEAAMLVGVKLKRAADFHGHLCPDLVIGHRAGQTALARLAFQLMYWSNLRVIVENTTSAVDAIQLLTGCTLGNRRLLLRDDGKHVYTFVYGKGEGLRLSLRPEAMPESSQFLALEERIQTGRATMLETARYQALLDERIAALLAVPADMLFSAQCTAVEWPEDPLTSALVLCDGCGELVVETHLISNNGKQLCRPCSEKGRDSD